MSLNAAWHCSLFLSSSPSSSFNVKKIAIFWTVLSAFFRVRFSFTKWVSKTNTRPSQQIPPLILNDSVKLLVTDKFQHFCYVLMRPFWTDDTMQQCQFNSKAPDRDRIRLTWGLFSSKLLVIFRAKKAHGSKVGAPVLGTGLMRQ